jgi:uncharacterized protein
MSNAFKSAIETVTRAREAFIARVARVVTDRPKRTLAFGFVLLMALFMGGGTLKTNMAYYIWFPEGDTRMEVLDDFEQRFGSDLTAVLVVHSPSGLFDKESAELIVELTDRMWKLPDVVRVDSLSNFSWTHAEGEDDIVVEDLLPKDKELTPELLAQRKKIALEHDVLPGFLVSRDGKSTVIVGWLRPTKTDKDKNEYNNFPEITAALSKLKKEYDGRGDHELKIAGYPVLESWLETDAPKLIQAVAPLMMGVFALLLFVTFRRVSGALLPFAVVVPTIFAAMGFMGWVGYFLNPMTIAVPDLMIIIAVVACDNILHAYYRALDRGATRREATRYALEETLWPSLFANVTVGIGFLSLLGMRSPPFTQLGVTVAVATLICWVFLAVILAPLMVLLPIKPKKQKVEAARKEGGGLEVLKKPHPRAVRAAGWLDRYKYLVVAGWAAVCGVSVYLAVTNEIRFEQAEWYHEDTDVRQGMDFVRERMGVTEMFEVLIDSGEEEGVKDPAFLGKVDALDAWLGKRAEVVQTYSLIDILKETNRALMGGDPAQYRIPDNRRAIAEELMLYTLQLPLGKSINERVTLSNDALRLTVMSRARYSPVVMQFEDDLRAKAKELGLDIQITGRQLLFHRIQEYSLTNFFRSLGSGTIAIGLVLFILFRSFRLGVLSLITNLVPILIGLGIVITLMGNSYEVATVSTLVLALGVSVDDSIHFLTYYHQIRRESAISEREAIARVWTTVGPAMLSSAIVLAAGYSLLITVPFPLIQDEGILMSSVLVVNFLADFILGSALLLIWKRRADR